MKSMDTEIHIIETTAEEVLENVSHTKSEIGITILNDYQLSIFQKMADIKDVAVTVLGKGPLYVHMNEKHPLIAEDSINAIELCDYPYIHLPYDFFSNLNLSLTIGTMPISSFHKTITMSNYHAIINMINHTDAFMFGNIWQVGELKHSHIKSLLINQCDINNNFVIVRRKREMISDAGKVFLDIINETYSSI